MSSFLYCTMTIHVDCGRLPSEICIVADQIVTSRPRKAASPRALWRWRGHSTKRRKSYGKALLRKPIATEKGSCNATILIFGPAKPTCINVHLCTRLRCTSTTSR